METVESRLRRPAVNPPGGEQAQEDRLTIDFSTLDKTVDTVELSDAVVEQMTKGKSSGDNGAQSLEIIFTGGASLTVEGATLGEKVMQAGGKDITISNRPAVHSLLNNDQQSAIGNKAAYSLTITSDGKPIMDMGGKVTVHLPYEPSAGEQAEGLVVFSVDETGRLTACETSYDSVNKRVSWKAEQPFLYLLGHAGSLSGTEAEGTYIVQSKDTLWAIAKKYGISVTSLVEANSSLIKNPNQIYPGWKLRIPQNGGEVTLITQEAILPEDRETAGYIVKQGDTLWVIAKKYGCTVAQIIALNGELIDDPAMIFAGWELNLPKD